MPGLLHAAPYAFNLLVLLPVCAWLLLSPPAADELDTTVLLGAYASRVLLACLWTSVLLLSLLGLRDPRALAPLLLFQIVYKGLFLLHFVLPHSRKALLAQAPGALVAIFVVIVATYPWVLASLWARPGSGVPHAS